MFGVRQRFARAHTCRLASEAGREESEPKYSGDLGEYGRHGAAGNHREYTWGFRLGIERLRAGI